MRKILFRGQTRRLGEKVWMNGEKVPSNWVYGGICHGKGSFSIIYGWMDDEREAPIDKHVVYTDTVGQYTGLTDKNGKKIFEGDIVKEYNIFGVEVGIGAVHWSDLFLAWHITKNKSMYSGNIASYEVIGNIHDNPELLEGGE